MNEMYFDELESTGQLLMSRFHQLSAGNSGSGSGSAPLRVPVIAPADARDAKASSRASAAVRRINKRRRRIIPAVNSKPHAGTEPHAAVGKTGGGWEN